MSAVQTANAQGFLARFDALRGQLPGDIAVREAAATLLRTQGLPSIRAEAWKYTNLRPLAEFSWQQSAAPVDAAALLARLPLPAVPRLVLLNGVYRADLSSPPPGMRVGRFAETPNFGGQARPEREPMVALNTMLAADGLCLTVPAGMDAGLVVIAHLTTPGQAVHARHHIVLEQAARLSVLEICLGEGVYLHNPVTEIDIADNAAFAHARLQDEAIGAFHLGTLYVCIGAHATYDSFSLAVGARLARNEVHASLAGVHATAQLNAAQLLRGVQLADFTTVISHDAPHGASRQTVKNVLTGRSRGVFQGKIHVARGAQKTDGYQMNQALLLSPDAEIDCKPQLEIYADDVKCSHGATVGELDTDQLFYLRSRGVPEADARALLVRAFLTEAIETVTDDAARAVLDNAIEGWWQGHPA